MAVSMASIRWTNPSVKLLAAESDPVKTIVEKTRELLLMAMDNGWKGPPFDPFSLAQLLRFSLVPREDILDARLISSKSEIEYNPNKAQSRIRFSIAHEIAHTLFPDYAKSIHNRSDATMREDDWQIELLCNIAAAEILMPVGPELNVDEAPITMERIIELRRRYHVSTEAVLLRLVKLTSQPIMVFAAAKVGNDATAPYRIDYAINSATSNVDLKPGTHISSESVLSECSASGFTAKSKEKWSPTLPELDVECIGVVPYVNNPYPRVLGIIKTNRVSGPEPLTIHYVIGNALKPRGKGQKIIAQVVNNESRNWGRGFGFAVSKEWPNVRKDWHTYIVEEKMKLGKCRLTRVSEDIQVCSMIAQRGYGPSDQPRIRYRALRECLNLLSQIAIEYSATVHMPRIGTGYAGGNWQVISQLIDENLIKRGVEVTVYELPSRENYAGRQVTEKQAALDFAFAPSVS